MKVKLDVTVKVAEEKELPRGLEEDAKDRIVNNGYTSHYLKLQGISDSQYYR